MFGNQYNTNTYIRKVSKSNNLNIPKSTGVEPYEDLGLYKIDLDKYILFSQRYLAIMMKGVKTNENYYDTEEGKKIVKEVRRVFIDSTDINTRKNCSLTLPDDFVLLLGDERKVLIKGLGKSFLITHPDNIDHEEEDFIRQMENLANKADDVRKK